MDNRNLRIGAAQLGPIHRNETRSEVVERLLGLLREAHKKQVQLIVYPELALTTFFPRWFIEEEGLSLDDFFEKDMPGKETRKLFDAAKEYGIGFCLSLIHI